MKPAHTPACEVFGVGEFAKYKANIYNGCSNDCLYCCAKTNAERFKRKDKKTKKTWNDMEFDEKAFNHSAKKHPDGRTMFPTSHDINPAVVGKCTEYIRKHLDHGNELLIVTKPHYEAVRYMVRDLSSHPDAKRLILFMMTMGSSDTETLKFWEPGAPSFSKRFTALRCAYDAGFKTSVLAEPMLDDNPEDLITIVRAFVTDAIWLGLMNMSKSRLSTNVAGNETILRVEHLLITQSPSWVMALYSKYKDDPLIKWKKSIKKIVGLAVPTERGLNI